MAAFVPATAAAAACAWTPAASAVCAKRVVPAAAAVAHRPARRVRAGRVAVTAAAAKPVDVTADTFDAEVMESVRFVFLFWSSRVWLHRCWLWSACGAGSGGGGGQRPVAGGADGPRPVGEEALALAKLVCVSCWRRVVGVLPHLMAAGWCALARGRWAGPAGGRCGLAHRTPPPPPHQAVTGAFCCGRIHGAARVSGRPIRRLGAELWGPAGPCCCGLGAGVSSMDGLGSPAPLLWLFVPRLAGLGGPLLCLVLCRTSRFWWTCTPSGADRASWWRHCTLLACCPVCVLY